MTPGPDDVVDGEDAEDDEGQEGQEGQEEEEHHDLPLEEVLDELREMPVGTNDPNIVGDAGPYDVPPGGDPPEGLQP